MALVGKKFPNVTVDAISKSGENQRINILDEAVNKQTKVLLFWYPKDFTFVCPTEIAGFGKLEGDFKDRDAVLIGASTDSDFVHAAWRGSHNDLKPLTFPWLADIKKELASKLGILNEEAGVANRATFIVDPENIIRYAEMTDLSVGRNPNETLRILDALQTDELCPCNWHKGEATL